MHGTIKKWGNSASIRIPAAIMEAANISLDMKVDMQVEGDCVTIRPIRRKKLELGDLLAKITPENQHSLVDFGSPRGKEIW
jgi:antitoxin MazE